MSARTHGLTKTPEYRSWINMRMRCEKPYATQYKDYGGRGIRVCERWEVSFEAFLADVGPRPSSGHQIDRIDNEGHYEPGNVRWLPAPLQHRNTRFNRLVEFNGERLCIAEWASRLGVTSGTVAGRIYRGWPLEKALALRRLPRGGFVLTGHLRSAAKRPRKTACAKGHPLEAKPGPRPCRICHNAANKAYRSRQVGA